MIKRYFKKIKDIYERGDAREESFYSILKELIEEYANKIRKDKISITTLPKKTEGETLILESGVEKIKLLVTLRQRILIKI